MQSHLQMRQAIYLTGPDNVSRYCIAAFQENSTELENSVIAEKDNICELAIGPETVNSKGSFTSQHALEGQWQSELLPHG